MNSFLIRKGEKGWVEVQPKRKSGYFLRIGNSTVSYLKIHVRMYLVIRILVVNCNRVFSYDVTAAMLVSQTSPVGVELFSYANAFFCSNKFA